MTGYYNHRIGTQANVIFWDTPWAPSLNFSFLPQRFKQLHFDTAMFGKWHLGMYQKAYYPSSRGFDEFIGYMQGCISHGTRIANCCQAPNNPQNWSDFVCSAPSSGKDYRGSDWFNGTGPDLTGNNTASSEVLAGHAERYIAAHQAPSSAPFFLYLPFQNIHAPYDCSWDSYSQFLPLNMSDEQRTVFGYLFELDVAVGRIVAAVNAAGLTKNTVIVFASDNGAPADPGVEGRNYPYFGFKASVWEGGIRVPSFVHAPGRLLPADVSDMVHVTDWTPTLIALAGGTVEPGLDGLNVWSSLQGHGGVRQQVPANINPLCDGGQFGAPKAALRLGDLKLVCWCYSIAGIAQANQTGCIADPQDLQGWPQLYNLTSDPGETTNIAATFPAQVKALEAALAVVASTSVEPMQWTPPYQGPNYACSSCPLHPATNPLNPELPWEAWL